VQKQEQKAISREHNYEVEQKKIHPPKRNELQKKENPHLANGAEQAEVPEGSGGRTREHRIKKKDIHKKTLDWSGEEGKVCRQTRGARREGTLIGGEQGRRGTQKGPNGGGPANVTKLRNRDPVEGGGHGRGTLRITPGGAELSHLERKTRVIGGGGEKFGRDRGGKPLFASAETMKDRSFSYSWTGKRGKKQL